MSEQTSSEQEMSHARGLGSWFRGLSSTWQSVVALALAVSFGVAATLTVMGFVTLPERVSALEAAAVSDDQRLDQLEAGTERQERIAARTECILLAYIQEQRWESCLASNPLPPPQRP